VKTEQQQHYSRFAEYYDAIYNEIVDYKSQTSFLERIFAKFHKGAVRSILDMGCGTGNFTLLFGERGYVTTGIDLSDEMIRVAKEKKNDDRKYKNVQFLKMDMRDIRLGYNRYDVGTVLFGGFGYLLEYGEVRKFFAGVRRLLKKDGLLVFEFWHVSGVRPEGSSGSGYVSWQKVRDGDRLIIRLDANKYDPKSNIARVLFDFYIVNTRTKELVDSFSEMHQLKTYTMSEMRNLLEDNGFQLVGFFKDSLGSSGKIEIADQSSFRILAVASPN
jgi:SAM-dependent methyltransferase